MAFYLAFKEMWRNKGRFLLIGLVIALITTLVLFIAALAEGLGLGNREYIENLDAELLMYQKNVEFSIPSSRVGRSQLNNIARVPGVKEVGPIGFASTSIILSGQEPLDASLIGVEPGKPGAPPAREGHVLQSRRSKEAVIDQNVALEAGLKIGDTFTIKTIQGTEEKFYTLRVVGITDSRRYSIQPSVFVPLLAWDEIKPKAQVERDPAQEFIFNVVAVKLDNPASREVITQRIEQQVSNLEAADLKTAYENTPGYGPQQSTLNTQRTFTLLIGILVIGGFFQIQTLQKVAQIGVLKAIGASNLTVAIAAMLQIIVVTILGIALGGLGTLGLSLALSSISAIVFTPTAVVTAIVTLLLIGPLGGLVSIRLLLRVEPLRALGLAS
ncbi:MAG: ABC transporter permease [Anaerolineales bacterium]|nr:ABC transporter permease [Anaerolineales bacterium]